ncbi:ABC transporter ATP-binding protein [Pyrococcus furiosus DSM 3638]|uniref:ABC transporter (ATP-binding protein) n=3 Tax=Pyrococcus furiosus TaxID=2261 RepID=Q8U0W4_PYRFU|nr:ABC transporter ATP-binding protein [Pyrococcus furiosus]AAL81591.1 putative ABC transporter (ATP-binding protein) [Pyrococcus furiosus DSM 3638]AFN04250.1 ABC transporter [Pyrococcus furiosus COM1]QEK79097.1 ABC transporter ATP-binding protein [Pyrococcus furiosus DSM 3638]
MIECSNLSKSYGKVKALDNVSFRLKKGLSLVVGPNGSGKTTLIKILSKLTFPDSGEILVLGKKLEEIKPNEITFAFEKTVFYPRIKVGEYLKTLSEVRGCNNVEEVIEKFELKQILNKRFSQLSQGFKRRFLVATAFIGNPKVIILDEPFSNVDISAKNLLTQVLEEESKK